jgi:hypothetical protein
MDQTHFDAMTRTMSRLPSRRDVLHGLAGAGLGLAALVGWPRGFSEVAARKKRKQKKKKKNRKPLPSPPPSPPPFNEFGCLDVGQPCQGDSTLCCSGICDPNTSRCIAHNSGICFPDNHSCITGQIVPCNVNNDRCGCTLTTGNAGFCGDLTNVSDPAQICRFCSTDTDCQGEFGPGAACVVLKGPCSAICASTGRTACVRPCA